MDILSQPILSENPGSAWFENPARRSVGKQPVYAITDIHGRADLLARLLEILTQDAKAQGWEKPKLVFLGDYIDRGPDSKEVLRLVREEAPKHFNVIYLKGNHEEWLREILRRNPHSDPNDWYMAGGCAMLKSYGLGGEDFNKYALWNSYDRCNGVFFNKEQRAELPGLLEDALGSETVKFLYALEAGHAQQDYFFVHAGLRPRVKLEQQTERDMLWIRNEFLDYKKLICRKFVVHGHTPNKEKQVEIRPNRINLDVACWQSNRLHALAMQGKRCRLLTATVG